MRIDEDRLRIPDQITWIIFSPLSYSLLRATITWNIVCSHASWTVYNIRGIVIRTQNKYQAYQYALSAETWRKWEEECASYRETLCTNIELVKSIAYEVWILSWEMIESAGDVRWCSNFFVHIATMFWGIRSKCVTLLRMYRNNRFIGESAQWSQKWKVWFDAYLSKLEACPSRCLRNHW